MFIASLATFILLNTETIPDGFGIEYILVEVFSCLGTVGLTMGLTPSLTIIGKIILILLMLIGRVGVMTFLWSLTTRKHESGINYPEMSLLVGYNSKISYRKTILLELNYICQFRQLVY